MKAIEIPRFRSVGIELLRLTATLTLLPLILIGAARLQNRLLVLWYPNAFTSVPLVETTISLVLAVLPVVATLLFSVVAKQLPDVSGRTEVALDVILWPIIAVLWLGIPTGLLVLLFQFEAWIGCVGFGLLFIYRWNCCVNLSWASASESLKSDSPEAVQASQKINRPESLADEFALIGGLVLGIAVGVVGFDVVWRSVIEATFPAVRFPAGPRTLTCISLFGVCCVVHAFMAFILGFGMLCIGGVETSFASREAIPRSWAIGGSQFLIAILMAPLVWLFSGFGFFYWMLLAIVPLSQVENCPRLLSVLSGFIRCAASLVVAPKSTNVGETHEASEASPGTQATPEPVMLTSASESSENEEALRLWNEWSNKIGLPEVLAFVSGLSLGISAELVSLEAGSSLSITLIRGMLDGFFAAIWLSAYVLLFRSIVRRLTSRPASGKRLAWYMHVISRVAIALVVVGATVGAAVNDAPIEWRRHVDPVPATLNCLLTVVDAPMICLVYLLEAFVVFSIILGGLAVFALITSFLLRLLRQNAVKDEGAS